MVGSSLDAVRFGVAGCQAYESGFYTAHRKMAEEDLDFVFCYGDYIYEGRGNPVYQSGAGPQDTTRVHLGGEVYSLDDYRRRYSQYTADTDLQASRASAAWFCTYDDHEIDNNWVGDRGQDDTPPEIFDLRRAAGYIFVGLPVRGSDTGDYLVRNILGVDPQNHLVAIGEYVAPGDELLFCRRDQQTAEDDLKRMLAAIRAQLNAPARGGVYYSCLGRGRHMFGAPNRELGLIRDALGDVPLVGFFANGEISRDRLYGYTGVLTLFA